MLTAKVQEYIESQADGSPIFIDDIVSALEQEVMEDEKKLRQNITVICSRLLHKIEGFYRFDVGIYYYTTKADGTINRKELTKCLYLKNKQGDRFGLLTGNSLAFKYGLSRDPSDVIHIMTNNWRRAQKCSEEEPVKLSAPLEDIHNENVYYFEILELLKWNPKLIDNETERAKLMDLISDYDVYSIRLMAYAVSYYNQKVVLAVASLAPFYLPEMYSTNLQSPLHK